MDLATTDWTTLFCLVWRAGDAMHWSTLVAVWWWLERLHGPTAAQWVRRKTAILEGDITIGYLFSMHEQPDQKSAHRRTCGRIWCVPMPSEAAEGLAKK